MIGTLLTIRDIYIAEVHDVVDILFFPVERQHCCHLEICRICSMFQYVKIWMDLLMGLQSYEFLVEGWVSAKFTAPPSGKTVHQTRKSCQGARMCLRPLSPFQVWCGSHFTCRQGDQKCSVFLFVCVSVTLLKNIDCVHNFALKTLKYRNYFDIVE